jgi:uncharacterized protein (DUF2225 family)
MSESQNNPVFILFSTTLDDFLSNLKKGGKYTKRIEEMEEQLKGMNMTENIREYNRSIKKYEKRFLNEDITVISRISNKIFSQLKMGKLLSEMKDENRKVVWEYLKTLYMYSEMTENGERVDLSQLIEQCKPEGKSNDSLDTRIVNATNMISNLMGDSDTNEMSSFKDLIKNVGIEIGDQIKNNGGEIDTASVMKSFTQMMSGGDLPTDNIGGIDMSKVIENATRHLTEKIERGEIDMDKFKAESSKNLDTLMKSMGRN